MASMPTQCLLLAVPVIVAICNALIGYSMRNVRFWIRWVTGITLLSLIISFVSPCSMAEWKKILPQICADPTKTGYWLILNSFFLGLIAISHCGIFGGQIFYKKHGIDSYKKVVITSLCAGQVYFRKNKDAQYKALKNLLKVLSAIFIGHAIALFLFLNPLITKIIEENFILKWELIGLLYSILVFILCLPANLHYLIFGGNDDIEVIPPYDFTFFSSSIRDFWKNWSRPVGEVLRYIVYEPLGGRERYYLSVPAVFVINCLLHYDTTKNVYGYEAKSDWNKAFSVMGLSMIIQMLTENIFLKKNKIYNHKKNDDNQNNENNHDINYYKNIESSIYWKIWCYALFNVSMIITIYILSEKAMIGNIQIISNTFLGRIAFEIQK